MIPWKPDPYHRPEPPAPSRVLGGVLVESKGEELGVVARKRVADRWQSWVDQRALPPLSPKFRVERSVAQTRPSATRRIVAFLRNLFRRRPAPRVASARNSKGQRVSGSRARS